MKPMETPIECVLEAIAHYGNQKDAAAFLGIGKSTVSGLLVRHGLAAKKGGKRKVHPEEVAAIYEQMKSAKEVAAYLGVAHSCVLRNLKQAGVQVESSDPNKYPLPMPEVIAHYQAGKSTREIGAIYGVDAEVIRRRLNRRHIQMRPRGGEQGEKNPQWKGGNDYKEGKYQARKTYKAFVGKPLLPGKVLHHMNEDTADNSPDNLWEFPNNSCHARYHQRLLNLQRQGLQAEPNLIALENGGVPLRRLTDPTAALPSIVPPNPFDKQEKSE